MEVTKELDEKLKNIDEIQNLMVNVYGKYDHNLSMLWMTEELGEVVAAIRKGLPEHEVTEELGDLIVWIFNIGNILNIKIEDAMRISMEKEVNRQLKKYGKIKYDQTN